MNEKRIPAGEFAAARLSHATGDLIVSSWAKGDILAQADGDIDVETVDSEITLTVRGDCTLTLPAELAFRFGDVAGDAIVTGVTAPIDGKRIGGDLRLIQTGPSNVAAIGGDTMVDGCTGNVQLGAVGGDLVVDSLAGDLSAGVGGDMTASSVRGGIAANTGGDVHVDFASVSDFVYAIQAGGDIDCRLPAEASATLNLQYGGSLRTGGPLSKRSGTSHVSRLVLGAGATSINLMAGGDISLATGSAQADSLRASSPEYGAEFTAQLEDDMQHMADNLGAQLGAMATHLETQLGGLPCGDEIAIRIQERVQRAMERAEANVEKAMRRAERHAARAERRADAAKARSAARRWPASRQTAKAQAAPVSDEERAAVLRMVEEGKVTVEQAEMLLSAMEA